ncbi:MAG: AsmA family protein, partial [Acidobacteriaceae bacterium]
MRNFAKALLLVIGIVVVFLIAASAWATHHVDHYLPQLTAYIQNKTGKQVEIRHATVSLLPLSVELFDVGIRNPKPFPSGYFLKVPRIHATVAFWPLLHRTVLIRSLVLRQPVID